MKDNYLDMGQFDRWNRFKKGLHSTPGPLLSFNEGEIWVMTIGINLGNEQSSNNEAFSRPVLILKKFNAHIFLGIPMTSKIKTGPYYFPITSKYLRGVLIFSQVRLFDALRLRKRMGILSKEEFDKCLAGFIKMLTKEKPAF